jgi:hypothetical protein
MSLNSFITSQGSHTHCMALDFGIVTYHVTSYLSICSRNLASSASRRRPFRSITPVILSWQSVSVSRCTSICVSSNRLMIGLTFAHDHHLVSSCRQILWRLSMNLSQAVSGAQPKSWLDSRLTQLRRAPKSLPVQSHSFLSRAHHLIMHEPLSQRACLLVPFSLCSPPDFLISLKERAHGYPDTDDAEGGYSGTLQRFAFALQSRRNSPTSHFSHGFLQTNRAVQSPSRNRWCQLAALRRIRHLETHHLAIRTALAEGDRRGWRHGRCCERYSCEPRGDVQSADAGAVWKSV